MPTVAAADTVSDRCVHHSRGEAPFVRSLPPPRELPPEALQTTGNFELVCTLRDSDGDTHQTLPLSHSPVPSEPACRENEREHGDLALSLTE